MQQYLSASHYINWQHPLILTQAHMLANGCANPHEIANACFEFVRDQIQHSGDYSLNPVTCRASDVLRYRTGYCYAKSHLLAALLRANGIPAGLCYQRLTISHQRPPYCLHGLNAVHLDRIGWYRIDPRGNRDGIQATFCPPTEQLAFPIQSEGECDLPEIWPAPLPEVVAVLETQKTYEEVSNNLPDIELISPVHSQSNPASMQSVFSTHSVGPDK
ncbi:MAG: transglutaminase family protein [Nitrospirales bacterium]|nr:transglutaminase family protein [Nitrospira sp.]MDR4502456.1 transglutaminase family protein [Nitrospirales bacterium]